MKKRIFSMALALTLTLSFVLSSAPLAAAAEKSIWDKINDGDLLYGLCQPGVPMPVDMNINELSLEDNVNLVSRLGVKAYALWIDFGAVFQGWDTEKINEKDFNAHKSYVKQLKDAGLDVIGRVHDYSGVPRRDLTEGSEYMQFLDTYYHCCKRIVELFPEIQLWQFYGCGNSIEPSDGGEYFTYQEQAAISVDMMFYSNKAIREANPEAVSVMQTIDGGFDDFYWFFVDFLTEIYENITKGLSVGVSTDPNDYFQVLAWNFYFDHLPGEDWLEHCNAIYDVAVKYGDTGKKVFLIEGGYSDTYCDEEYVAEWIEKLFECVEQTDYIANVCYFAMYDGMGLGLFSEPYEGNMPKKSAFALQEIYGGTGDLLEYTIKQSACTWPYQPYSQDELSWGPFIREYMWHQLLPGTVAANTGSITVQVNEAVLNSDYSFFVRDVENYRSNDDGGSIIDREIKKGDPRITVSGNTITLDVREINWIAAVGFTVRDEGVDTGVEGVYLDVAYDGTETAYLPYIRAAVSNALLPGSQSGKFDAQITREDFDAFYVPLFERKYGYDYDFTVELDVAYNTFKADGGTTRGDCVKAIVRQFEQWSGEKTPHLPASWSESGIASALEAGLFPLQLQNNYAQSMTRAEFCALGVALYEKVQGEITGRKTFNDTKDINVEKMAAVGVVTGTDAEKGLFSPSRQLTREQAATMLSRLADALGKPLPNKASEAADKDSFSSWAAEAIGQMQASGVMTGTSTTANVFSPKTSYSREQSILTILRLYDLVR